MNTKRHTVDLFSIESATQFVYHYTTAAIALEKILPARTLRMSPYTETRDPKEAKNWVFHFGASKNFDGLSDKAFFDLQTRDASQVMKGNCKLLCLTTDGPGAIIKRGSQGLPEFDFDTVWHRGFCRPRMWAQYAGANEGVCLVFDRQILSEVIAASKPSNSIIWDGTVRYLNRAPFSRDDPFLTRDPFMLNYDNIRREGLENEIRKHVQMHWRELFLEKATDWSDEREFRWVMWDTEHQDHVFDFRESLHAVVAGCDFREHNFAELQRLCKLRSVPLVHLTWQNGYPQLMPRN